MLTTLLVILCFFAKFDAELVNCFRCDQMDAKDCFHNEMESCRSVDVHCYHGYIFRDHMKWFRAGCITEEHRFQSELASNILGIQHNISFCSFKNCNNFFNHD